MYTAIRLALRASGVDYLSVAEAGNRGLPDDQQLAFATSRQRSILTANRSDFSRLHWEWVAREEPHSGIIVITDQRIAVGTLIAKLLALQEARHVDDMANEIVYLNTRSHQRVK